MAILKLKNAGEEATLAIESAEIEQGQYGEQVKFSIVGGDVMWVPLGSVVRQLDRCKAADIPDLSGKTLHFFRAPNSKAGSAPFWNIDLANDDDISKANTPAPKTNGKPPVATALLPNENGSEPYLQETGAPPTENGKLGHLRSIHAKCFREVLEHYVPTAAKAGLEISLEGASALTFQLYKMETDLR
jgi:hypothetical protein